MPKKPKTPEEINEIKEHILQVSIDLIKKTGYENFSMRALASTLNVTPPTIYQYYSNKDELYLTILTKGFEKLYDVLNEAYNSQEKAKNKLYAVGKAYIDFGIKNPNLYDLMLVSNVPKFYDYVGTPAEETAKLELETAIKVINFAKLVINESGLLNGKSEEEAEMVIFELMCATEGMVSYIHNKTVNYLFNSKDKMSDEEIVERFLRTILNRIDD